MARNIILFLASAGVLVLLFIGFLAFFRTPTPVETGEIDRSIELQAHREVSEDQMMRVDTPKGPLDLPPGEEMKVTQYDRMGRPMDYYRCKSWEKAPNSANLLTVVEPEIVLRLNTGMVVQISAERGEWSIEQLDPKQYRPKRGTLTGEARIVIDRETELVDKPLSERPEDSVTIAMTQLEFDLELGELHSDGPLEVDAAEFSVRGTGLHLIWNQDENRIEKLSIDQGDRLVFRGDFLDALSPGHKTEVQTAAPVAAAPAPVRSERRQPTRKPITYRCLFSQQVSIEHLINGQRRAFLSVDELDMLMDLAGRGTGLAKRDEPADAPVTTQSASVDTRPAEAEAAQVGTVSSREVVVRWSGPLVIRPEGDAPDAEQARRRVTATGKPIRVELPDGRIACNRLVLHEEDKRLWLYPMDAGYVEFAAGPDVIVHAAEVCVDWASGRIKLIGEVLFQARREASDGKPPLTIQASSWAELQLAQRRAETQPASDLFANPLAAQALESAVFVGDVRVSYEDQRLYAHQLTAEFGAGAGTGTATVPDGGTDLRGMLKAVTATGDVRLLASSARRAWWRPPDYDRTLTSGSLRLDFVECDGLLRIREMHAAGMMEIHDRANEFDARGRELHAVFAVPTGRAASVRSGDGREELEWATVTGTSEQFASLRAREFDLRGREIAVDNRSETLHVDGPSDLALESRRGLQGFARADGTPIKISCTKSLHIDGKANTVKFVGAVSAGAEHEKLVGETMTLFLEDVPVTTRTTEASPFARLIRPLSQRLGFEGQEKSVSAPLGNAAGAARTRKDLARIQATEAGLVSETYANGGTQPLVHQSIAAPRLDIDALHRCVRTFGQTTMLMTDLRMKSQQTPAERDVNMVSSLMGGGPSQTAVSARNGMLYALGESAALRRDSLLLEGGVKFRRVTGSEMAELPALLPDVAQQPELLKKITSSNTYLECERLEGTLVVPEATESIALGNRASVNIDMLNAAGNVYFRDKRGDNLREIYAAQLEYNRQDEVFRILGQPEKNVLARIYDSNEKSRRFNAPVQAPALILHLDSGTIEATELQGRLGN